MTGGEPVPGAAPLALALLARCTFPPPGADLTCAVSGGPDSLALLVLARHAGCEVTAVHVDHGIRPGSGAEADLVAAAAARVGARFSSERVVVVPGPNLEARARAARFAVLPPGVATGHTMDDQAETVLCNLLRGTGPDGVAGMRAGHEHPILELRRSETRAVCLEAGLEWLEDPTNTDPAQLRNRVRHELLPLCAEMSHRDPVPLLARFASLQAQDSEYLAARSRLEVPDPCDAPALVRAPAPLATRAVRRWLRAVGATAHSGGRPAPRAGAESVAAETAGAEREGAAAEMAGAEREGVGLEGVDREGADREGADRQPPSLADVRRVLAVAAGDAVATEVTGGWRVRRSRGRLVASPPPSPAAGDGAPLVSRPGDRRPASRPVTTPATRPASAPAITPATSRSLPR